MKEPSYYGILPANVRYDTNLSMSQKVLYTELTALTVKCGYCYASNAYFGRLYGVNPGTASLWINKLKDRGHIRIEGQGKGRKIYLQLSGTNLPENLKDNLQEKLKQNNTSINIPSEVETSLNQDRYFIKFWNDLYFQNFAVKWKWYGKDVKLLRDDIEKCSPHEGLLQRCMERFFADKVPVVAKFVVDRGAGHTYGVFHSQLHKILEWSKVKK
jgi:hypothetical protein